VTGCRAFAPAKINLTLHVTGQREDGYHLLDSLVVFAEVGDWVSVTAGPLSLAITGPQAAALPVSDDNLVLRAARVMGVRARIELEKHLPIASGIGGGSADAAACLRALAELTGEALPDAAAVLALGADVPVCLAGRPVRMQGVGEVLTPVPALPQMFVVLVNPGVAVATPEVFKALSGKDNPAMRTVPEGDRLAEFVAWLADQRNDLEAPAQALAPVIGDVKAALAAQAGCLLARMSGSGATCFGLFATANEAEAARLVIAARHHDWWCAAGGIRG
jgi:4-diphosphocytidyl-2-C-methyl-D-erythritol kinase